MKWDANLHKTLKQIGSGDSSALESLVKQIRRPLTNYLMKKYSTSLVEEDINDAVQYTIEQIWRQAGAYRGSYNNASAKKWIFTIADRHCWKLIEASRKYPHISLDAYADGRENQDSQHDQSIYEYGIPAPEDTAYSAETLLFWQEVKLYVNSLSEKERIVFLSWFEQGLNMREIGLKIRRSKPRVKQILDGILTKIKSQY
jgi:RNA polymerase sigma factor (sigma-70 family)